jgi:hypothetical protein
MTDYIDLPAAPTVDLSGYAQLGGAAFTGPISATNLEGTNTGDMITGDTAVAIYDFTGGSASLISSDWQNSPVNSGTVTVSTDDDGGWGVIKMNTNTSANGGVLYYHGTPRLKDGVMTVEARVKLDELSSGTSDTILTFGFMDNAPYLQNNTVSLVYYKGNFSTDNWIAHTYNGATETIVDTGVSAVAGQWDKLKIVCTNNTEAKFYIGSNGGAYVLVATITTNIPASTYQYYRGFKWRQGSTATTNKIARIDYYIEKKTFTTAR